MDDIQEKAQSGAQSSYGYEDRTLLDRIKTLTRRLIAFNNSRNIFTSKLSWKISGIVFLTIMFVQAAAFFMTREAFINARLYELKTQARSSILPMIDPIGAEAFTSPILEYDAKRIFTTTNILGLSIFTSEYEFLDTFGKTAETSVTSYMDLDQSYYHPSKKLYETILTPEDLGFGYIIVVSINASQIQAEVANYTSQSIFVMIILSLLVTTVLMITLGYSLLEPLLFLQRNLLRARQNPEKPEIEKSPYGQSDEIGTAINAAHDLIHQNAKNIQRMRASAQDKINKLAFFDTLTGLPNRSQFIKAVNEKIQDANPEQKTRFVLVAIDLDHFKDINDSMGHKVGDEILKAIGKRLTGALPETAMVARNGEDEFALYVSLKDGGPEAREIASRLSSAIKDKPFNIYDEDFQVRASIGYAVYPDDASDPDLVLKNADIALNRAKEEGRDTIRSYSKDFDQAVQQRFQMLRDLRVAMEENQLLLHYQPQFDLKTGAMIGAEALIRWWKPDNSKEGGRFISPGEFIPIAESSGLIVQFGEWVLRRACQTAMKMQKAGHPQFRIAVNVSAMQFTDDSFVALVANILKETGLEPHLLELEVTESVFMEDINHTISILQQLNGLGVELAIDDFGTGYSSLAYLRQFPIDRLKIDQSFIRNALNSPDDAVIAKTIIALGHSLNLKVIAEGVETRDHEEFLRKEGCDEVQGFRYSKPISENEFETFLSTYEGNLSIFDESFAG